MSHRLQSRSGVGASRWLATSGSPEQLGWHPLVVRRSQSRGLQPTGPAGWNSGTVPELSLDPLRGGGGLAKEVALGQIEAHLATDLLFFFIFHAFGQASHSHFLYHLGQRLD